MQLQGLNREALQITDTLPACSEKSSLISKFTIEAVAHAHLHSFPAAENSLTKAEQLCSSGEDSICGNVVRAGGVLAVERGEPEQARKLFDQSLAFGRSHHDQFLEATALLNLGLVAANQERFDEAKDQSNAAYEAAYALNAKRLALVAQGNLGWAYYKLGDSENALDMFRQAEARAAALGDFFDQENELTNIGYVHMDEHKFDLAAQSFGEALKLAERTQSKEDIYNALRVLARFSLITDDLASASHYAERALGVARDSGNHVDQLYPMLVLGQVAAHRGAAEAEDKIREVETDKSCPVFLKWEAEHALAQLYESEKRSDAADREYRNALATFEGARNSVHKESSQLSFLANASRIYDDYIHFLIAQGKRDEALKWADFSRARTLAEGLGLLDKESSRAPWAINPQEIARRAKATLLFYWLGEKQSYLWAITSQRTTLFSLPPASEMDAAVQRYQGALANLQDVLATSDPNGIALYETLVAPARAFLGKDAKVLIVPDGSLNKLNFETLLVEGPRPHYWIEDANVSNAPSLRMLSASAASRREISKRLLLVGDAQPPDPEFGRLPNAKLEMANIEKYFSTADRTVYSQASATPTAYLDGGPQRFSYIHFVAHGTASSVSPLDSAVILSQDTAAKQSFKLYARDIIQRPLHAKLVTISTCFGAGSRAYTGEGLVGLSWAFLRAGAHHVIGALWEADDIATPELMDHFYGELRSGEDPAIALRSAKLSLLHSTGVFRKPFYWAPFQLYTGS